MATVTTLLGELTLPARSVTVTAREETAAPSPVRVWFPGHAPVARPEPPAASLQVKSTTTSSAYQPKPLGSVVAAPLTTGLVRSILTVTLLLGSLTLPAASLIVTTVDET